MNKQISGYLGGGAAKKTNESAVKEGSASGLVTEKSELRSPSSTPKM